jgi:hypothetical protein
MRNSSMSASISATVIASAVARASMIFSSRRASMRCSPYLRRCIVLWLFA